MKTIQELYNEVLASDELKKEFLSLKPEEVEGFSEKYGCKATLDEIKSFLAEKRSAASELSDEEIEQITGGKSATLNEAYISILGLGIVCAIRALHSATSGKCGTAIEGKGTLCSE